MVLYMGLMSGNNVQSIERLFLQDSMVLGKKVVVVPHLHIRQEKKEKVASGRPRFFFSFKKVRDNPCVSMHGINFSD